MNKRTWNIPLVTFLSGCNTVLLKDKTEVQEFILQMGAIGIDVSSLNNANCVFGLLVEFNNGKGIAVWNYKKPIGLAIQDSKQWFEIDPFNWEDIKYDMSFADIQEEYWKQLILSVAEAKPNPPKLSKERLKELVAVLLNDDEVWDSIDGSIKYYLEKEEQ